jgi:hypothetical protein
MPSPWRSALAAVSRCQQPMLLLGAVVERRMGRHFGAKSLSALEITPEVTVAAGRLCGKAHRMALSLERRTLRRKSLSALEITIN